MWRGAAFLPGETLAGEAWPRESAEVIVVEGHKLLRMKDASREAVDLPHKLRNRACHLKETNPDAATCLMD